MHGSITYRNILKEQTVSINVTLGATTVSFYTFTFDELKEVTGVVSVTPSGGLAGNNLQYQKIVLNGSNYTGSNGSYEQVANCPTGDYWSIEGNKVILRIHNGLNSTTSVTWTVTAIGYE